MGGFSSKPSPICEGFLHRRLAVPGTERATPFDDPNAQQLFSDIGSSMMSLPLGLGPMG